MAEEFQYAAKGAAAGAAFGPAGVVAGALIGGIFGGKARRAKREAEIEADVLKATEIGHAAYETGRVARHRAGVERGLLGAGGVSTASLSAADTERATMVETIYQQEALLAGLPKGRNSQRGMFEMYNPRNRPTIGRGTSPHHAWKYGRRGTRVGDPIARII